MAIPWLKSRNLSEIWVYFFYSGYELFATDARRKPAIKGSSLFLRHPRFPEYFPRAELGSLSDKCRMATCKITQILDVGGGSCLRVPGLNRRRKRKCLPCWVRLRPREVVGLEPGGVDSKPWFLLRDGKLPPEHFRSKPPLGS